MSTEATIYQVDQGGNEVIYWRGYRPDCRPQLVTVREVDETETGEREVWVHAQRIDLALTIRMIPLDDLEGFFRFLATAQAGERFRLRYDDADPPLEAEFEVVQEDDPAVDPEEDFPGYFRCDLVIRVTDETNPLRFVTP